MATNQSSNPPAESSGSGQATINLQPNPPNTVIVSTQRLFSMAVHHIDGPMREEMKRSDKARTFREHVDSFQRLLQYSVTVDGQTDKNNSHLLTFLSSGLGQRLQKANDDIEASIKRISPRLDGSRLRLDDSAYHSAVILDIVAFLWDFIKLYMDQSRPEPDDCYKSAYGHLPMLVWHEEIPVPSLSAAIPQGFSIAFSQIGTSRHFLLPPDKNNKILNPPAKGSCRLDFEEPFPRAEVVSDDKGQLQHILTIGEDLPSKSAPDPSMADYCKKLLEQYKQSKTDSAPSGSSQTTQKNDS
ncbi:hypothetical protein HD806DRAFT_446497 [Xylariaceae sp. AK1471]|nr:hypothetical protein HD806DRAFT_446497 [Xylariaceae sp. AK1471]